jgi:hypothetical protein
MIPLGESRRVQKRHNQQNQLQIRRKLLSLLRSPRTNMVMMSIIMTRMVEAITRKMNGERFVKIFLMTKSSLNVLEAKELPSVLNPTGYFRRRPSPMFLMHGGEWRMMITLASEASKTRKPNALLP